jgi:hypothetical protein
MKLEWDDQFAPAIVDTAAPHGRGFKYLASQDQSTADPIDILNGLSRIRGRRRITWMVFLTYLPAMLLIAAVFGVRAFPWAAILWMALYGAAGIVVWLSRCPRCHRMYHYRGGFSNPWTQECMHCKLSLHWEIDSVTTR